MVLRLLLNLDVDVCIEVAAAFECNHASHLPEAARGCDKACGSKTEKTCDDRGDCCSTTRVKAPENACTDQSCSPSNRGTSRLDGDDTCGGQGCREGDNECEDFVGTEKDNSIYKSVLDWQSQCCSPVKGDKPGQGECATASRDENADVKVDIGCRLSCCDKPRDKQDCKKNDSLDRCRIDNDGEKCCASKDDRADRVRDSCCSPDRSCSLSKVSIGRLLVFKVLMYIGNTPDPARKASTRRDCTVSSSLCLSSEACLRKVFLVSRVWALHLPKCLIPGECLLRQGSPIRCHRRWH